MLLTLIRDYRDITCTLGVLSTADGLNTWQTIEQPWTSAVGTPAGMRDHSCVPAGTYELVKHSSEEHPGVWALVNANLDVYHYDTDVPIEKKDVARTVCLIHSANLASELEGCIAPGKVRARNAGMWEVLQSRDAVAEVRAAIAVSISNQINIVELASCQPQSSREV
jgi:hypothetical protein